MHVVKFQERSEDTYLGHVFFQKICLNFFPLKFCGLIFHSIASSNQVHLLKRIQITPPNNKNANGFFKLSAFPAIFFAIFSCNCDLQRCLCVSFFLGQFDLQIFK